MTNLLSPQLSAEGQQPHHQLLKKKQSTLVMWTWWVLGNQVATSALRKGIFNIGLGRELERKPGSQSGRSVELYGRVYFLLSGISGFSWVFSGISGYIGYHLFFLGRKPGFIDQVENGKKFRVAGQIRVPVRHW